MSEFFSYALGTGTKNKKQQWLEVFYPAPLHNANKSEVLALCQSFNYTGGNQVIELNSAQCAQLMSSALNLGLTELANTAKAMQSSNQAIVLTLLEQDAPVTSTPEAYLKLHLLSHRLVKPHGTDLSGIFAVLPNVAWTNEGAIDIEELAERQLSARLRGESLQVTSVDKFPKMADYVVPSGVRIAATSRVRLGAYIGEGTTVMHEGFCNFNAGTAGTSMIEGRVSAGVFVGKGSDLGGGCSTMGTLSGGGNIIIAIGEESLIGANAGVGIPLGDRCTVESGLYITAGTKVALIDDSKQTVALVKARDLAGKHDLLFRRNSQSGAVECLTNKSAVALNEELHAHN
ncbi:2,3,4,5-tetrahydropyridine-2,6-dicarboxylate N-succinyltransferase [Alginatibacterium sediminis]|uniref:2,3,4,5-tetrahydropyridine-2,6-dicarboxylate N-succinyltransferase n=1 Tax=Alginatibacterium sediminis TaxID=2164068 RepID=A0A420E7X8_9ALTE|nr:2,3,4,5-tetrahydropyridine-2,6-dicarboxylate N-succinyltransferase [Alginatibacterium sediminis]RKF15515.1 2,3,4,5-tetrahydropyridine-2,6-dicarboxylate N-succinyltransferase [Alginatibacterium sediminis]